MTSRVIPIVVFALAASVSAAAAQATFTPSYNAPYRAFAQREFGATFSFPDGGRDFALEGQFRFGYKKFDIGLKGGVLSYDGDAGSDVIVGVEGRGRVLDHTQNNFPFDGAIVIGVGTANFDGWTIPSAGLSLGRRVDLDGFSFILYGQPTMFIFSAEDSQGNSQTDVEFGLGFGGDFKVGQALDLRVSAGVFDGPEGLAVSLVWVR
jgi:hypothetical protein